MMALQPKALICRVWGSVRQNASLRATHTAARLMTFLVSESGFVKELIRLSAADFLVTNN